MQLHLNDNRRWAIFGYISSGRGTQFSATPVFPPLSSFYSFVAEYIKARDTFSIIKHMRTTVPTYVESGCNCNVHVLYLYKDEVCKLLATEVALHYLIRNSSA